ncbi:MAG: hypothetical protein GY913_19115 [Proteobacteria bacterium]|nr:hypothetical protein [Pseudomonadota bacterium]MCP4919020.1 hypothetical protein [Pseudomonadota bacterium]
MILLLAGLAQADPAQRSLTAGITLPWLSHPGLVVGAQQPLGEGVWFAGVDLAGWVNPRDSLHAQATPKLGAAWVRPSGRHLSADLGVGLASESLILGHELDLGDGSSTRTWDHQFWVVPQVSTQVSWRHDRRFPVFLGLTLGQPLAPGRNGGTVLTVDFGLVFGGENR